MIRQNSSDDRPDTVGSSLVPVIESWTMSRENYNLIEEGTEYGV